MRLTLTNDEAKTLAGILAALPPGLRVEVDKTENYDFREERKRREARVNELLNRLGFA